VKHFCTYTGQEMEPIISVLRGLYEKYDTTRFIYGKTSIMWQVRDIVWFNEPELIIVTEHAKCTWRHYNHISRFCNDWGNGVRWDGRMITNVERRFRKETVVAYLKVTPWRLPPHQPTQSHVQPLPLYLLSSCEFKITKSWKSDMGSDNILFHGSRRRLVLENRTVAQLVHKFDFPAAQDSLPCSQDSSTGP